MFGLMKGGPRMPYCGTCKTLGALYGQKTRFLTNHDIAFLAEVLLDVAGVSPDGPYLSRNCLRLPGAANEIPEVLRYAAAVTVALAYFRAADHLRDASGPGSAVAWRIAVRALEEPYRRAAAQLRAWHFPLDEMAAVLETQAGREAGARSLEEVAEPTMTATAMVFAHGVSLAGQPERAAEAWSLGSRFGELIYLLDAIEDRQRDARTGSFNPLMSLASEAEARARVREIAAGLERVMNPQHAARLRANLDHRLALPARERREPFTVLVFASGPQMPQGPQIPRQYPMAQPDRPGAGNPAAGCKNSCKDSCLEGIVEGIFDSICNN